MIKAVLFDLDGTLLPMDMNVFMKAYFNELGKVLCPLGITPELLVKAMLTGTEVMKVNDGSRTNKDVFWTNFEAVTGQSRDRFDACTEDFYTGDFNNVRSATGANPLAAEAVRLAHRNDRHVVLATNPFFPYPAQLTRASWVGLCESDFELITSFEDDSYCKPNPAYFISVCDRIGVRPEECLMVGNDVCEDMRAAIEAGLDAYLVTDCMIPCDGYEWNGKKGTFSELCEYLRTL